MYAFDCIRAVRRMWLITWLRGPTALKIDRYILILLTFFSLNAFANGNPQITGTVVGVADGDTLTVLDSSKREHRVRLAEIDAPESSGQAFGNRAKQALSRLCYRKLAKVIVHTKDRYGRNVGAVTCDGVNANEKMVESGLAWVYTQYASANSPLFGLEQQARLAKRGLWRDANPVPPWEWRKRR